MITKISGWFSKVGKGVPQTHQKTFEGELIYLDEKDEQGNPKPKMGNEQYLCEQLTDESVSSETPDLFVADVMEVTGSDLAKAARCFREGWNRITRLETGGDDPFVKAAKGLHKMATASPDLFKIYKGKSIDEIAEMLREANK